MFLTANNIATNIEYIILFNVLAEKIMYSIFVAILFEIRIYNNSVHCLPNSSVYIINKFSSRS